MANLATWMRPCDGKYFTRFFSSHPEIEILNGAGREVDLEQMDGLLLTGGADIAPEFLRQEIPDVSVIEKDADPKRDAWEFAAVEHALARSLPLFAICKGMQVLNVALGGTLHLDISGHNLPEQKTHDVQPLRSEGSGQHRFAKVNSSHHQAIAELGEGLEVESWCATDGVIEQVTIPNYSFALAVQYHPERGNIYNELFEDFFSHLKHAASRQQRLRRKLPA